MSDLDEAAAAYVKARHGVDVGIHRTSGNGIAEFVIQAFKAGIEWQRAQNQVKGCIDKT